MLGAKLPLWCSVTPMPRFYLHLKDDDGSLADEQGMELANPEAAKRLALQCIADIIAEEPRNGRTRLAPRVIVEDERRAKLAELAVEVVIRGKA